MTCFWPINGPTWHFQKPRHIRRCNLSFPVTGHRWSIWYARIWVLRRMSKSSKISFLSSSSSLSPIKIKNQKRNWHHESWEFTWKMHFKRVNSSTAPIKFNYNPFFLPNLFPINSNDNLDLTWTSGSTSSDGSSSCLDLSASSTAAEDGAESAGRPGGAESAGRPGGAAKKPGGGVVGGRGAGVASAGGGVVGGGSGGSGGGVFGGLDKFALHWSVHGGQGRAALHGGTTRFSSCGGLAWAWIGNRQPPLWEWMMHYIEIMLSDVIL